MKIKNIVVVIFSLTLLGALYGFVFHSVTKIYKDDLLLTCILMSSIFGLINSIVAIVFINKYGEVKTTITKLGQDICHDKLTGLLNRRALEQDIKRLNPSAIYSMIFLDIDDFRNFNNQYGHPIGDKILRKISEIILARIRNSDTAYRYGGEEIVILLNDCGKEKAEQKAWEIVESVRNWDNAPYGTLTISAGVAAMPQDAHSFEKLVETSDKALLKAKTTGKNKVISYPFD